MGAPLPVRTGGARSTTTLVGAGIDSLSVAETPADIGVFLTMRIVGASYEFEETHALSVTLVDPESEESQMLGVGFGPIREPPAMLHPGIDPGITGRPSRAVDPIARA